MKDFHKLINKYWEDIVIASENYKLVNVFKDRIEGVS